MHKKHKIDLFLEYNSKINNLIKILETLYKNELNMFGEFIPIAQSNYSTV